MGKLLHTWPGRILLGLTGLVMLCCVSSIFMPRSTVVVPVTAIPANVAAEVQATQVTEPTAAPTPSPVPTAIPTAIPEAPAFTEIRDNMQAMTDAQWVQYSEGLKGLQVTDWQGYIQEVNAKTFGGYEVWIDMDSPDTAISVQEIYFDVPEDVALTLNIDQPVTFSGQIKNVLKVLGSTSIYLDNGTIQ